MIHDAYYSLEAEDKFGYAVYRDEWDTKDVTVTCHVPPGSPHGQGWKDMVYVGRINTLKLVCVVDYGDNRLSAGMPMDELWDAIGGRPRQGYSNR